MDEDKVCPLCGKEKREGDVFCDNCKEIAENEFPEFFENEKKEPEITTQDIALFADESGEQGDVAPVVPIKKQHNKKKLLLIILGALFLFGVIGVFLYSYSKKQEEKRLEIAFWDQCIEKNTPPAYSDYLLRYPSGIYKEDAESRIRRLRDEENEAWKKLRKSSDITAFSAFLNDYPNSPYERFARSIMDSLAWLSAKKDDTKDGYKAYMENVKLGNYEGKYQPMAQERYDYLDQLKSVEGEELDRLYAYLSELAKLFSTYQYTKIKNILPSAFIGFKGDTITSEAVINNEKNNLKKNKIKKITYSLDRSTISAIKDNKGIYFVEVKMKCDEVYTNRRKSLSSLSFLNLELDKNYRLLKAQVRKVN